MEFKDTLATEISNSQLVDAMYASIENNAPEARQALYQALIDSTLILPTDQDLRENANSESNPDMTLRFFILEDEEGNNILPAFTDQNAVLAWMPEGTPYVALKAPQLFAIATRNPITQILINPSGPVSGRVHQNEFAALAQGQLPYTQTTPQQAAPEQTRILIGKPQTPPPTAWHNALQHTLQNHTQIAAAYMFQLYVTGQEAKLVVGVHFTPGTEAAQQEEILQSLFTHFSNAYDQQEDVHFVALEESDFLQTVKDTVPALYTVDTY
jgi:hypothetical protein